MTLTIYPTIEDYVFDTSRPVAATLPEAFRGPFAVVPQSDLYPDPDSPHDVVPIARGANGIGWIGIAVCPDRSSAGRIASLLNKDWTSCTQDPLPEDGMTFHQDAITAAAAEVLAKTTAITWGREDARNGAARAIRALMSELGLTDALRAALDAEPVRRRSMDEFNGQGGCDAQ